MEVMSFMNVLHHLCMSNIIHDVISHVTPMMLFLVQNAWNFLQLSGLLGLL